MDIVTRDRSLLPSKYSTANSICETLLAATALGTERALKRTMIDISLVPIDLIICLLGAVDPVAVPTEASEPRTELTEQRILGQLHQSKLFSSRCKQEI